MMMVLVCPSQGGLPTFLDVGQSFSASAITEDNLLGQLLAVNKTLVSFCDVMWHSLCVWRQCWR